MTTKKELIEWLARFHDDTIIECLGTENHDPEPLDLNQCYVYEQIVTNLDGVESYNGKIVIELYS